MQHLHHILISRLVAITAFGMFLVLTPRAWVDPENRGATEEIPVSMLEQSSDCLWCDKPAEAECNDGVSHDTWLNPDAPLPSETSPCPVRKTGSAPSS